MENGPFIDDFPIKTSIYKGFSMAMLNYQRVKKKHPIGSMYAIYGNIYHQYTPNVSIYTIHGSYGNRNILNKKHTSNMVHPLTLCQANVEDLKAQLRTLRLELGEADRPFWIAWGRDSKMGWEYIEDM